MSADPKLPMNYEERIAALEKRAELLQDRIAQLEALGGTTDDDGIDDGETATTRLVRFLRTD